jgi:hypothetical protein
MLKMPSSLQQCSSSPMRFRLESADSVVFPGVHIVGPERVVVGRKASIRAGVVLDASDGPVIVGDGAVVMPNATVVGPVAIGAGSLVKAGARILGGTSIGRVCKVGGEVGETIFSDFPTSSTTVWDTVRGRGEHRAARTQRPQNYGPVRMWCAGDCETGRRPGLVMGIMQTGINAWQHPTVGIQLQRLLSETRARCPQFVGMRSTWFVRSRNDAHRRPRDGTPRRRVRRRTVVSSSTSAWLRAAAAAREPRRHAYVISRLDAGGTTRRDATIEGGRARTPRGWRLVIRS